MQEQQSHQEAHSSNFYPNLTNLKDHCPQLTNKMRGTLVSWLVEVHLKFELQVQTLYVAVNIIDRFCEKQNVTRENFQLLGITALFIAAKY